MTAKDIDEIRADIGRTRAELARTAAALIGRADVSARVREMRSRALTAVKVLTVVAAGLVVGLGRVAFNLRRRALANRRAKRR